MGTPKTPEATAVSTMAVRGTGPVTREADHAKRMQDDVSIIAIGIAVGFQSMCQPGQQQARLALLHQVPRPPC